MKRTTCARLTVVIAFVAMNAQVGAQVIAEDEFDEPGSGSGWAVGDTWDDTVSGGVATVSGFAFRNFANPIDTSGTGLLYISFKFQRMDDTFGGISYLNGDLEELFVGHPSVQFFGFNVTNLAAQHGVSTVPLDTLPHTLTVEVDFGGGTGGKDVIRFFIDNSDLSSPDATFEVDHAPTPGDPGLPDTLTGLRIGTDGTVVIDDLCVSRDPPTCGIPAVSVWGMALLGLLLLTVATIVFRGGLPRRA